VAQMGFFYDMTACIGCKTCQIACKDKNDLAPGLLLRRVIGFEGGKFPQPWVYYLSLSCNHCSSPLCVSACPTGALYKEAQLGAVLIDQNKCSGCRKCQQSCPYGHIQYNESTGKVAKCDMCRDLIVAGEQPACAGSCVMRALDFGPLDELEKRCKETRPLKNLPNSGLTGPSIVITPKPEALRAP